MHATTPAIAVSLLRLLLTRRRALSLARPRVRSQPFPTFIPENPSDLEADEILCPAATDPTLKPWGLSNVGAFLEAFPK